MPTRNPATVVIGIGAPDRGDDAAGRLVARRVRELAPPGVAVAELEGEPAALIEAWQGAGRAVVVDALVSGRPPGTIVRIAPGDAERVPARRSSHGLGLGEAIGLGRALGQLPGTLVIFGIEGARFGPGEAPTPAVLEAVGRLAAALAAGASPAPAAGDAPASPQLQGLLGR